MSLRPRTGIQLAYPFEERRLRNEGRFSLCWHPPYIIQPKLNGERCRLINAGGRVLLLSSTEEIISTVPHINQAGTLLPPGEYDGELYVHGWTFSEIHSVVSSTVTIHPRAQEMQLHLFDVITSESQAERIERLDRIKSIYNLELSDPRIQFVRTHIAWNRSEIMSYYDQFIAAGYEGFILRHIDAPYSRKRSAAMMKFKPKQKDHYLIVGVKEAISESGTPLSMLGAFICDDGMGETFDPAAGQLTHHERRIIWEKFKDDPNSIIGQQLEVAYQTMSDKKGVPLFCRASDNNKHLII